MGPISRSLPIWIKERRTGIWIFRTIQQRFDGCERWRKQNCDTFVYRTYHSLLLRGGGWANGGWGIRCNNKSRTHVISRHSVADKQGNLEVFQTPRGWCNDYIINGPYEDNGSTRQLPGPRSYTPTRRCLAILKLRLAQVTVSLYCRNLVPWLLKLRRLFTCGLRLHLFSPHSYLFVVSPACAPPALDPGSSFVEDATPVFTCDSFLESCDLLLCRSWTECLHRFCPHCEMLFRCNENLDFCLSPYLVSGLISC